MNPRSNRISWIKCEINSKLEFFAEFVDRFSLKKHGEAGRGAAHHRNKLTVDKTWQIDGICCRVQPQNHVCDLSGVYHRWKWESVCALEPPRCCKLSNLSPDTFRSSFYFSFPFPPNFLTAEQFTFSLLSYRAIYRRLISISTVFCLSHRWNNEFNVSLFLPNKSHRTFYFSSVTYFLSERERKGAYTSSNDETREGASEAKRWGV